MFKINILKRLNMMPFEFILFFCLNLILVCSCSGQTVSKEKGISDEKSIKTGSKEIKTLKDISYGKEKLQKMDVYYIEKSHDMPVIFMVHGGAWCIGDKSNKGTFKNKVEYWVNKGYVFISVNYRMLPEADVLMQAKDIVSALIVTQKLAKDWGGDPEQFILMGHSAGAHLVALISSNPSMAISKEALPWIGSVLLDSAALNVKTIMEAPHFGLYDKAFGTDLAFWVKCSPLIQMTSKIAPILAVCSSRREASVLQSKVFIEKAISFGTKASVLSVDMSHGEINDELGLKRDYTKNVDEFMNSITLRNKSK
jgi:acetyl esterase/lipase